MTENSPPDTPGDPEAAALADTHRRLRIDLAALLRSRGPEAVAGLPVAACPEWTVHETVSHLVGVGTDIVAGNLEGVATDAWTEAQVAARRGRSLAEVLDEWDAVDPGVEDLSPAFGEVQAQWCMDCLTHVADIRQALGEPLEIPGRQAMLAMICFTAGGYALYGRQAGVPLAHLVADGVAVTDGEGIGPASVALDAFELLRGLTGRRSPEQLRAWPWQMGQGAEPSKMGQGAEPSKMGQGAEPSKMGQGAEPSKMGQGAEPSKMGQGAEPSKGIADFEPWLAGFDWGPFRVRPTPLDL